MPRVDTQHRREAFGIEGTGSYGAGLAGHLRLLGVQVIEVNRPDRALRHRLGKSDPIDAEAPARAGVHPLITPSRQRAATDRATDALQRHADHADFLREAIQGRIGEADPRPDNTVDSSRVGSGRDQPVADRSGGSRVVSIVTIRQSGPPCEWPKQTIRPVWPVI
jgi:hypothetical protein